MILKKVKQVEFRRYAVVLSNRVTRCIIERSGEAALFSLYGSGQESLDSLRYKKFCKKVATNPVFVESKWLPPISSAAKFHFFLVYYQVRLWMGKENLNPCDWGLKSSMEH